MQHCSVRRKSIFVFYMINSQPLYANKTCSCTQKSSWVQLDALQILWIVSASDICFQYSETTPHFIFIFAYQCDQLHFHILELALECDSRIILVLHCSSDCFLFSQNVRIDSSKMFIYCTSLVVTTGLIVYI